MDACHNDSRTFLLAKDTSLAGQPLLACQTKNIQHQLLTLGACAARVTVVSLCVCVCVYLSVTALTATYLICKAKVVSQGSLWRFTDLRRVDFAKNASFNSYGVICLPPLPSTLQSSRWTEETAVSSF